jgi:hypothetical protein
VEDGVNPLQQDGVFTFTVIPDAYFPNMVGFVVKATEIMVDWGDGMADTLVGQNRYQCEHSYLSTTSQVVVVKSKGLTLLEKVGNFRNGGDELQSMVSAQFPYLATWTELNIEHLTQLTELSCTKSALTKLDISKNVELMHINCDGNSFDTKGLNDLFENLPERIGIDNAVITISENPGTNDCGRDIAVGKGWKVEE